MITRAKLSIRTYWRLTEELLLVISRRRRIPKDDGSYGVKISIITHKVITEQKQIFQLCALRSFYALYSVFCIILFDSPLINKLMYAILTFKNVF